MIGLYPHRMGLVGKICPLCPTGLPADVNIMPEYFKEAGYSTHAIGKVRLFRGWVAVLEN